MKRPAAQHAQLIQRMGMHIVQIACGVATSLALCTVPAAAGQFSLVEQHWIQNCMGCHTTNARGVPGKVPPLANSLGYFEHVPDGREYVMRVPGSSNSALSDQELADVLNWLLTTRNAAELPADFKPYTAAEIAAHRRPALANVAVKRAALIKQLHEQGITGIADHY
ncbi:c-type cytochrome [Paraburkholderia oxyphila]|uniref:c-type cytochrome n=1 Tax=Paraburkholderia oxyphila TaxID=614212 RepID=UPI000AFFA893|nr:cytochrome c [Paraburkholderia oxyphila]